MHSGSFLRCPKTSKPASFQLPGTELNKNWIKQIRSYSRLVMSKGLE